MINEKQYIKFTYFKHHLLGISVLKAKTCTDERSKARLEFTSLFFFFLNVEDPCQKDYSSLAEHLWFSIEHTED